MSGQSSLSNARKPGISAARRSNSAVNSSLPPLASADASTINQVPNDSLPFAADPVEGGTVDGTGSIVVVDALSHGAIYV